MPTVLKKTPQTPHYTKKPYRSEHLIIHLISTESENVKIKPRFGVFLREKQDFFSCFHEMLTCYCNSVQKIIKIKKLKDRNTSTGRDFPLLSQFLFSCAMSTI